MGARTRLGRIARAADDRGERGEEGERRGCPGSSASKPDPDPAPGPAMMDGYQVLANRIILQAVRDWRHAVRAARETRYTRERVEETEAFFQSGWFQVLTNLDGAWLLRRLKSEEGIAWPERTAGQGRPTCGGPGS